MLGSRPMAARGVTLSMLAALGAAALGCGTTEKSGDIGDVLSAKGLDVSVVRVDTRVPIPPNDVTGLSSPSPGTKLVGALVRVCSDHGGALGPYDFGIETSDGDPGQLKFPQMNYAKSFDTFRSDCGNGWVVFEIPTGTSPGKVTFGFQDTGSSQNESNDVNAHFSWSVG